MTIIRYSKKTKPLAQHLRKNATQEENHLWYDFLRNYPVQFYRQRQFGRYIVDFYCARARLVVELDGSQHYEDAGMSYDSERTAYLNRQGLEVMRFSNLDVKKNFDGVCFTIDKRVKEKLDIPME